MTEGAFLAVSADALEVLAPVFNLIKTQHRKNYLFQVQRTFASRYHQNQRDRNSLN